MPTTAQAGNDKRVVRANFEPQRPILELLKIHAPKVFMDFLEAFRVRFDLLCRLVNATVKPFPQSFLPVFVPLRSRINFALRESRKADWLHFGVACLSFAIPSR